MFLIAGKCGALILSGSNQQPRRERRGTVLNISHCVFYKVVAVGFNTLHYDASVGVLNRTNKAVQKCSPPNMAIKPIEPKQEVLIRPLSALQGIFSFRKCPAPN